MKVLWVMCNESLAQDVREILDEVDSIEGYTVWEGLYGADKKDHSARWGDAVWPGFNWAFWVTGEEADIEPLIARLRMLKETDMAKLAGIKAWIQDVSPVM